MTDAFCQDEFMSGTFEQDCMDHVVAKRNAANAAAEKAVREQEEAAAAAKAAEEAKAAQEDAVTAAWTAPVETSGESNEDKIKRMKKELAMLTLKAGKKSDDQALNLEIATLNSKI